MSKKDYEAFEAMFRRYNQLVKKGMTGEALFDYLIYDISIMFENDNESFDRARFLVACIS